MQTLDQAWEASESQSIEDVAAAMKEKARANVAQAQPKAKSKPAVAVAPDPPAPAEPKQKRKPRTVKVAPESSLVAHIHADIAKHKDEIAEIRVKIGKLRTLIRLLKGAA